MLENDNYDQEIIKTIIDTFFGGYKRLFAVIVDAGIEATRLQELGIGPEEFQKQYQDFLVRNWKKYVQELSDTEATPIEVYWWYQLFWDTGMPNGEINRLVLGDVLGKSLDEQAAFDHIQARVEEGKQEHALPSDMTPVDFFAILFDNINVKLHPGDPIYQVMGVKSRKDLEDKFGSRRLAFAWIIVKGNDNQLLNAIVHDLRRDYNRRETDHHRISKESQDYLINSGLVHKGIEYEDDNGNKIIDAKDDTQADTDLTDQERLGNLCKLRGICINDLTSKNKELLRETLKMIDMGYVFSSKQGESFKDFYGDKADSKKTMRSRLFNKIRRLANQDKPGNTNIK